jgi:DNA-binding response OmpR family regulator
MRPKKRILLAVSLDERMSILRFLLETHAYAVIGAETSTVALAYLDECSADLVMIDWPFDSSADLVDRAHAFEIPSMVIAERERQRPECMADAILLGRVSAVELLARIRTISARRRGPRPAKKPAAVAAAAADLARTA